MTQRAFEEALEIPGYVCEALIGRGGMGSVYRAIQLSQHRPVAVKVLSEAFRDDPDFVARFRREAELLAALEHPHIVPMLESGEVHGVPYIVMRLIDGPNLRQLLRHDPPEPWFVMELLAGVAAALDFAHGRGVLHRDVKPHNMLLDHGGHVWLVDFGLMRLAADGRGLRSASQLAGTFDYLAPELIEGSSPSVASDVYALAVSAFQLLTGTLPFDADHVAALLRQHASAPRPRASSINASLPSGVDAVLAQGMAIDPVQRPKSASAFVRTLSATLPDTPTSGRTRRLLTPTVRSTPTVSRSRHSAVSSAQTYSDVGVTRRPRRLGPPALAVALAVLLAVAGILVIDSGGTPRPGTALRLVSDRATVTRFDPTGVPGAVGPALRSGQAVEVSCQVSVRTSAAASAWYRIASMPWDQQFYAPATDFSRSAGTGKSLASTVPRCTFFAEIPGNGGGSRTWSDPRVAGGREGKLLPGFVPARVLCRVRGLKVQDGNTWWYRIGGTPWNGSFYASADAFYNNGTRQGTLHGSAFVDAKVPECR